MMMDAPEKAYVWPSLVAKWLCGGWSQKRFQDDAVEYIRADLHAAALAELEALRTGLDNAFLAIVDARSHADPGPLFRVLNELLGKVDDIRRAALTPQEPPHAPEQAEG